MADAFTPLQELRCAGLILRPVALSDADALFDQMFNDEETMRDLSVRRHSHVDETRQFINEALNGWQFGVLLRYVIACEKTGELTALVEVRPLLPRVEIGVVIARRGGTRRRRSGLVLLRTFIDWIIDQPGVYRLFATCAIDGKAQSCMERLGFTREGRLINYEARPNLGLEAADCYLFAITRKPPIPKLPSEAFTWLSNAIVWNIIRK